MAPKSSKKSVVSLTSIAPRNTPASSYKSTNKLSQPMKPTLPEESDDDDSESDSGSEEESDDEEENVDSLLAQIHGSKPKANGVNLNGKGDNKKVKEVEIEPDHEVTQNEEESGSGEDSSEEEEASEKDGSDDKRKETRESSEEESEANTEDEHEESTPKVDKKLHSAAEKAQESESESSTSDNASDDGKASASEPQQQESAVNASRDVYMKDAASSTSESDEESEAIKTPVPKPVKTTRTRTNVKKRKEPLSSERVVDSDASDDMAAVPKRTNPATVPFQLRGAGFKVAPVIDDDTSSVHKVLKEAKSAGQQLWYFTAPEGIPVSVFQQMTFDINEVNDGKSLLSHNGDDYTMNMGDSSLLKEVKLIVKNNAVKIDHVYHIQQVSTISAPLAQPSPETRGPRPQPKNLKPRCPPIGVADRDLGRIDPEGTDEEYQDEDIATAPPSSQPVIAEPVSSKPLGSSMPTKKRKLDAGQATSSPSKRTRFEGVSEVSTPVVSASVSAKKAAPANEIHPTPTQPAFSTNDANHNTSEKSKSTPAKKSSKTPVVAASPMSTRLIKQTPIPPPVPKIGGITGAPRPYVTPIVSSQPEHVNAVGTPTIEETPSKTSKDKTKVNKKRKLATQEVGVVESAPAAPTTKVHYPDTPRKSTEEANGTTEVSTPAEKKPKKEKKSKDGTGTTKKAKSTDKVKKKSSFDTPQSSAPRQVTPINPPRIPHTRTNGN